MWCAHLFVYTTVYIVCACAHGCTCCVPYLHVHVHVCVVQMYVCTCNSLCMLREGQRIQNFLTAHSGWGMNMLMLNTWMSPLLRPAERYIPSGEKHTAVKLTPGEQKYTDVYRTVTTLLHSMCTCMYHPQ